MRRYPVPDHHLEHCEPVPRTRFAGRAALGAALGAAFVAALCSSLLAGCATPPPPPAPVAPPVAPAVDHDADRIATLTQLGFQSEGDIWQLNLSIKPIRFSSGNATLSDDDKAALRRIGAALRAVGIDGIRVEGHTDSMGPREFNNTLSLRRAEAAAQELVAAGMDPRHVVRAGYGAEKPIASNASAEGRAKNRRVVLIVAALPG